MISLFFLFYSSCLCAFTDDGYSHVLGLEPQSDEVKDEESDTIKSLKQNLQTSNFLNAIQKLKDIASSNEVSAERSYASCILGDINAGIMHGTDHWGINVNLKKAFEYYLKATQHPFRDIYKAYYMIGFISYYHPAFVPENWKPKYKSLRISDHEDTAVTNGMDYIIPETDREIVKPNIPLSLIHSAYSAKGNYSVGLSSFGYKVYKGFHTTPSCHKAMEFYRNAAYQIVSSETQYKPQIKLGTESVRLEEEFNSARSTITDEEDIVQYYRYSADTGNVESQIAMGIFLLEGDIGGLPRDYDRAFHYFRIAAETGDPTAISHLAYCYQMGYGTPSDNITAKALYEKAAGMESATAQTQLGIMYYYGWGVERDVNRAKKYFLQASDRNDAEAYLYLGRMSYSGIGTTKSVSKAREHFSNAASGGNLVALYNLGILSANGLGMKVSCTNAVTFYRKILEMSVLKTALITAYKYYARGLYDKALIHYELAADQGEVLAQINAAWLYEMGIGVKTLGGPNSAESDNAYKRKALEFYIRAAEQLSPEAHLKVGDFFYYGWSVPPDPELAYHYYRAASNLRNAQATFNLGWMHQYGIGIPKDYHLAKRYYDQAIEHNDVEAYFPSQLALTSLSLTQFTESIFSTGLIYGYAWDNLLIALLLFSLVITVTIRQVMLLG